MTGVGPQDLLAGGREFFDALVERCAERRELNYEVVELLAGLLEIAHAQLRVALATAGEKPGPQIEVTRPGRQKRPAVNWRDLQRRVNDGH